MKPEKKKPSSKPVPEPARKTAAPKKKIVSVEPEPAPSKAKKKETTSAEPKKAATTTSDTVKAAVQFVKTAAKRAVQATKKIKAAVVEAAPTVKKAVRPVGKAVMEIPSILLEGDAPSAPAPSGPGKRYALGPVPPEEQLPTEGELPEAYGTQSLLLTARDPHWLYAHWDFTREQLRKYNAMSKDGHLVLRVYKNKPGGKPRTEIHVHPESRNWFVHVEDGGTKYVAELGYIDPSGTWTRVSVSGATMTPPDSLSEDTSVRFATIPVDVPFDELIRIVKLAVLDNVPLAEAIMQLRAQGVKNLPEPSKFSSAKWTAAQQKALGSLITMDSVRRVWIGSLEITELIRRQLSQEVSSMGVAQFSLPSSLSVSSLSSPFGGGEKRKGFWFNVNAELIIYGATEPDAKVEIGGRKIQLRSDGTFSFRFILPDGNYDLPAQATSADGDDTRSAHLKFSRKTNYSGEVGAHPQDPKMKKPEVANVS